MFPQASVCSQGNRVYPECVCSGVGIPGRLVSQEGWVSQGISLGWVSQRGWVCPGVGIPDIGPGIPLVLIPSDGHQNRMVGKHYSCFGCFCPKILGVLSFSMSHC